MGGANGYIVVYNGNITKAVSNTEAVLSGLSTAIVHNITIYGYTDIPSIASDTVSVLLDGKFIVRILNFNNDGMYVIFSSSTSQ